MEPRDKALQRSMLPALLINLALAGAKQFTGIQTRSFWLIALSYYYLCLALLRVALLLLLRRRARRRDNADTLRRCMWIGVGMFLISITLSGVTILVVWRQAHFDYPGLLIYVMAVYAFYSLISAVIEMIRYRGFSDPLHSAVKAIDLSAALTGIYALETAMLSRFGGSPQFRLTITAVTGAVVWLSALLLALGIILFCRHSLKQSSK